MATRTIQPSAPTFGPAVTLCDFCHLKPQFGGHPYCSKTCAAQAATYCNNCHLKPKFANFEYCGKNCAAQATANKPQPTVAAGGLGGSYQLVPTLAQMASKGAAAMKGLAAAGPALVATTVPKNITPAPAVGPAAQPQVAYASPPVVAPPTVQAQAGPRLKSNPFAALPNGNTTYTATVTTSNSTTNVQLPPSAPVGVCLIPGCGQPVHIDANGAQQSEYCSLTHREEAVKTGLVAPCIMCLSMPQCQTDYFCGRACRDEALCRPYASET